MLSDKTPFQQFLIFSETQRGHSIKLAIPSDNSFETILNVITESFQKRLLSIR